MFKIFKRLRNLEKRLNKLDCIMEHIMIDQDIKGMKIDEMLVLMNETLKKEKEMKKGRFLEFGEKLLCVENNELSESVFEVGKFYRVGRIGIIARNCKEYYGRHLNKDGTISREVKSIKSETKFRRVNDDINSKYR